MVLQSDAGQRNYKKLLLICLMLTSFGHVMLMPVSILDELKTHLVDQPTEQKIKIQLNREKARQIVQNTAVESDTTPKETDFLSERDQAFEKETVARETGVFKEAGAGSEAAKAQRPQEKKSQAESASQGISFSALGVKQQDREFQEMLQEHQQAQGQENGRQGETGLAQSNDYIEDLPLGDVTQLNTQEYKYYGFYHRIRQRLEQHWGASLQESADKMYRKGRRLPANAQRITALTVTMDANGNILDVRVRNASGIIELDEAAIESFNRAGPFPNPPEGMVMNGRVQIEWGFVVKS